MIVVCLDKFTSGRYFLIARQESISQKSKKKKLPLEEEEDERKKSAESKYNSALYYGYCPYSAGERAETFVREILRKFMENRIHLFFRERKKSFSFFFISTYLWIFIRRIHIVTVMHLLTLIDETESAVESAREKLGRPKTRHWSLARRCKKNFFVFFFLVEIVNKARTLRAIRERCLWLCIRVILIYTGGREVHLFCLWPKFCSHPLTLCYFAWRGKIILTVL